jgi:hypothetical protein
MLDNKATMEKPAEKKKADSKSALTEEQMKKYLPAIIVVLIIILFFTSMMSINTGDSPSSLPTSSQSEEISQSTDVKLPDFTAVEPADSAALTARMRQQMVAQINTGLLEMVNQSLATYGWQAKKVVADMDIAEDGSISMGQITLYVDEDTAVRATAVKQIAEKRLGTAVTVAVWEDRK